MVLVLIRETQRNLARPHQRGQRVSQGEAASFEGGVAAHAPEEDIAGVTGMVEAGTLAGNVDGVPAVGEAAQAPCLGALDAIDTVASAADVEHLRLGRWEIFD